MWASDWKLIPGFSSAYVDMASVRKDGFDTFNCPPRIICAPDKVIYTVAWLRMHDSDGKIMGNAEVVFDCHGKAADLQQVVVNETKDSPYHTFDNTQAFKQSGIFLRGIPPDSMYDAVQKLVCK